MIRYKLIAILLVGLGFTTAGCTKSLPGDEGVYVRQNDEWMELKPVPLESIKKPESAKLEVLEQVPTLDEPRVILVEKKPSDAQVYVRDDEGGWKAVTAGAAPMKDDEDVHEFKFPKDLPKGLVLIQTGKTEGVAFVYGADSDFYHQLGLARRTAGDPKGAVEAFEKAVAAAPNSGEALNALARTKAAAKEDLTGAMAAVNQAIEVAIDDAQKAAYFDTLGEIYYVMGEPKKAIQAVERALALDANNSKFQDHLVKLVAKAQERSPEEVLQEFYKHLSDKDFGDAAKLADPFDVDRLEEADRLKATFAALAHGAPFQDIVITKTQKHGKVANFEYAVVTSDGGRRTETIQLHYSDGEWKVSLQ